MKNTWFNMTAWHRNLWWCIHAASAASGSTQTQLMHSHPADPHSLTLALAVRHSDTLPLAANRSSPSTHQHWETTCEADDSNISPPSSSQIIEAIWCPEGIQLTATHTCFVNQGRIRAGHPVTGRYSRWKNHRSCVLNIFINIAHDCFFSNSTGV